MIELRVRWYGSVENRTMHSSSPTTSSKSLPIWSALHRLAMIVATPVFAVVRMVDRRRALMQLSSLDERMLKDIGLTRSDVATAMSEAWHRDPSPLLADRAEEYRHLVWQHIASRAIHKLTSRKEAGSSVKTMNPIKRAA